MQGPPMAAATTFPPSPAPSGPAGLVPGIDAVYVLSVKTYTDRIEHITREFGRHGIAFDLVLDFDADDLDADSLERFFVLPPPKLQRRHMSLVMKHIETWRRAVRLGHRRIMVFEDDVVLDPAFRSGIAEALGAAGALPPGWLIYLGGSDTKVPDWFFLHPGPLVPLRIATAEGYLTDLEACRRRLAWCEANKIIDPADHLIAAIDREACIGQYWPHKALVEQGSVTGLFRSVLDKNRTKHGDLYNVMRFRWMKWHRRTFRKHWVLATRAWRTMEG